MQNVLISPTEPSDGKAYFEKVGLYPMVSTLPEARGADYLIYTQNGVAAFQRKSVPFDFISSVQDGRLTKETAQLQVNRFRWVICEGQFKYFSDGSLQTYPKIPTRFNKSSIRKILMEITLVKGIDVVFTDDLRDTVRFIKTAVDFINKPVHAGLSTRPGSPNIWGVRTDEELDSWILQGFTGIGPALAKRILDHFGELPLGWLCTFRELHAVDGLLSRRAQELWCRLYPEESME